MTDSTDRESGRKEAERRLGAEACRLGRTGHCLGVSLIRSRKAQDERLSRLLTKSSGPCDDAFSLSENVSILFLPDMESTECLGLARTLRGDMGTAGLSGTLAACVIPGRVSGARPAGDMLLKRLLGVLKNLPDDGLVHRIASADLSPAPSACAIVRAEEKLFLFGGAAGRAAMRGTKCRKQ